MAYTLLSGSGEPTAPLAGPLNHGRDRAGVLVGRWGGSPFDSVGVVYIYIFIHINTPPLGPRTAFFLRLKLTEVPRHTPGYPPYHGGASIFTLNIPRATPRAMALVYAWFMHGLCITVHGRYPTWWDTEER